MNIIKKTVSTTTNFARNHKTSFTVLTTALTCLALNRLALKDHDEFLKEKGLHDEFYKSEK